MNRSAPDISFMEQESDFESQTVKRKRWAIGIAVILQWFLSEKKVKIVPLIIILVIVGSAYGVYQKFFNLSPEERAQKQLAAAVAAIEKHMILPEGDEPVLATITDVETLKGQQPFFNNAVNGDQLLLFSRSLKAVIYSPSRNKIVNAGPIQQDQAAVATAVAKQNVPAQVLPNAVSVEIRNGSGKDGFGLTFAEQIGKDSRFSVARVTDAKSNDYKNTVVVDIAKKFAERDAVNALASTLGASVISVLPNGEASSNADIVIILGAK